MTPWTALQESAAFIRSNFPWLLTLILPALLASFVVDHLASHAFIAPSEYRSQPLFIATVMGELRFLQFYLGWLFLIFEFAAISNFVEAARAGEKSLTLSVERVHGSSLQLLKLSWSIYWRAFVVSVPLFMMLTWVAIHFQLDRILGIWFSGVLVFVLFSFVALFGAKWLLSVPETVLGHKSSSLALQSCNSNKLEALHEPLLVIAILSVAIISFASTIWPRLLHFVYLPQSWPGPVVHFIQDWFTPASILLLNSWATMLLFVGTVTLWTNVHNQDSLNADPLHR